MLKPQTEQEFQEIQRRRKMLIAVLFAGIILLLVAHFVSEFRSKAKETAIDQEAEKNAIELVKQEAAKRKAGFAFGVVNTYRCSDLEILRYDPKMLLPNDPPACPSNYTRKTFIQGWMQNKPWVVTIFSGPKPLKDQMEWKEVVEDK